MFGIKHAPAAGDGLMSDAFAPGSVPDVARFPRVKNVKTPPCWSEKSLAGEAAR